jgi:hypothetical protein
MRPVLLGWHRADPATADDRARSDRVAAHQATVSGAPAINPFVVDSSLAARAFYPETLPTTPDVTVSAVVTSGAVVPSSGGRSCFDVTVANREASAVTVDVWYTASGPEAELLVTRFLRTVTIPAGQSPRGGFCQPIPGAIPDGAYTFTFAAGEFDTETAYGSDAVQIVKGGLARGANALAVEAVTVSPNPFSGAATIRFALAEPAEVSLAVYDALGRQVARLVDGRLDAGAHAATFGGGALPAGLYLYRLQVGREVAKGRLVQLR